MPLDTDRQPHFIDGEWREAEGTESIQVVDSATEEVIADIPTATANEVSDAISAARDAQSDWAQRPAKERGDFLREIVQVFDENSEELAEILVEESGKKIDECRGEMEVSMDMVEYNSQWDRRIEGDILPGDSRNEEIHLQRHPYGVVGAICPWNYPVAVFARKLAPALVTGNTLVVKPSEVTPIATLRAVELIHDQVDLPDGVLNLVAGGGHTGHELVTGDIDMVSMTGSRETGKQVMRDAADNLKHVSLELGGKAPAIVWKDADIDEAVEDILTARMTNTGQVCTCAERIYVHSTLSDEFTEKYVGAAENVTFGDPWENPDMGPQINEQQLKKTEAAVENARESGATILTGGKRPIGDGFEKGYYYEPTVVTDIPDHSIDLIQEEVFGPVSPIIEYDTLDEALEYANDSNYGLSAYLFTNDYQTAMRVANEIEFGELYINRTLGEAWHAHHIGWNESGMGGEDGKYGMLEYTQLKSVYHNF